MIDLLAIKRDMDKKDKEILRLTWVEQKLKEKINEYKKLIKMYHDLWKDKEIIMHVDWLSSVISNITEKNQYDIIIELEDFIYKKYKIKRWK